MKRVFFVAWYTLFCSSLLSAFDISPWFVIDNKTDRNLICQIHVQCSDYPDIISDTDLNPSYTTSCYIDKENDCAVYTTSILIDAHKETIVHSPFSSTNKFTQAKISSISLTNLDLQLTTIIEVENQNQLYFSIDYQPGHGFVTSTKKIPLSILCCSSFKQSVIYILSTLLDVANNWLPY